MTKHISELPRNQEDAQKPKIVICNENFICLNNIYATKNPK